MKKGTYSSFNRTVKELKYISDECGWTRGEAFNRTVKELKSATANSAVVINCLLIVP